jgi:hypothetical protein
MSGPIVDPWWITEFENFQRKNEGKMHLVNQNTSLEELMRIMNS